MERSFDLPIHGFAGQVTQCDPLDFLAMNPSRRITVHWPPKLVSMKGLQKIDDTYIDPAKQPLLCRLMGVEALLCSDVFDDD
jgi:hypothetical protein